MLLRAGGLCLIVPCLTVSADIFPANLGELFEERSKAVVAVEFFVQGEIERSPFDTAGLVADEQGLIVLIDSAIPGWIPIDRFRDFRVFVPGEGGDGHDAEYLGRDHVSGWHYLRASSEAAAKLVPISRFDRSVPRVGDPLWGIGILGRDFDHVPYLLDGRLALIQRLPLKFGFSEQLLAVPGGPVFSADGGFAGWAGNPLTQERLLLMDGRRATVGLQAVDESGVFLLSDEFFDKVGRLPKNPAGDPRPWIGITGMQPIDRDVAEYLGLAEQGALVVSTVLENTPADEAGLMDKDIIVGVNGASLPKFRPDNIVQRYFERLVLERMPGEILELTLRRGEETVVVDVEVGKHPKPINQAARQYFSDLGFTVREFAVFDAIRQRVSFAEATGVISDFVKPNSPVNSAGLRQGDWIKEIDGTQVASYADALEILDRIEGDGSRDDFVMLIDRNNETSHLRVKLR